MAGLQTALLWLLVSASWPEPARGAGSGARPAAAAAADRAEAAAAPPALQLLRVGERDAVISFHVSRLPGRLPATHFQLRVAAGGGGGGGGEELRKIAVKAGADCAATDGCQVAASAYTHCLCAVRALYMHRIYTAYVLPGGSRVVAAGHAVPALARPGGEAKRHGGGRGRGGGCGTPLATSRAHHARIRRSTTPPP